MAGLDAVEHSLCSSVDASAEGGRCRQSPPRRPRLARSSASSSNLRRRLEQHRLHLPFRLISGFYPESRIARIVRGPNLLKNQTCDDLRGPRFNGVRHSAVICSFQAIDLHTLLTSRCHSRFGAGGGALDCRRRELKEDHGGNHAVLSSEDAPEDGGLRPRQKPYRPGGRPARRGGVRGVPIVAAL